MRSTAQVVIVGGGAVGTAILYHLAQAGITDCLLLEKDELTSGSTWHAAGNIPTYATSWLGMRAGNYAWRLYKDLEKQTGAPITYRHTGAFWPAHTQARMDLFRHLVGLSKSAGFELQLITPAEMEQSHPFYQARADQPDGAIGAIFDPYEGDIDPSQLTQALAAGARAAGSQIARFTPVTGIERRSDGEWSISTPKGNVTCETLINAGGFYGAKIGQMAGIPTPVTALEHQYLVTEPLSQLRENSQTFPLVRDPDIRFYLRREGASLLLGSYAHQGRLAWPDGPPAEFAHQLFPDNLDELAELLEQTIAHVPLLSEAGVQRCVNGPIAYAPDALPLVGPVAGVPNFFQATGVQIGITHSAAIGKAMAEWLTEGETEWDLSAWDPRRFGDWATPQYTAMRACEHYGLQYAISYPNRILTSARPVNRTPLYETLAAKGAVFGQIGGWERAFWFDENNAFQTRGDEPYGQLSFHDDEPWREAVRAECKAVQHQVGIMDHGGFTKFEIEGPDAAAFLDRVFCGKLPNPGRVRLSYMLTPKARIWSEATIARLADDRFLLCGPTLALDRDYDWLQACRPGTGNVTIRKGSRFDGALMVMGPKSRQLLQTLTDSDLSANAQPWMAVAEIQIGTIPAIAMRVSYVGELGWELHVPSDRLVECYHRLEQEGTPLGLRNFGSRALNAMRLEKGYHAWAADFGIEYTPFDAGLDRFIAFDKADFVGRDAVGRLRDRPPEWRFWGFEIEGSSADPLAGDPISINGQVAGYVTSGGSGFRIEKRIALGYLKAQHGEDGAPCTIEILGKACPAVCVNPHFYDPHNTRLKA